MRAPSARGETGSLNLRLCALLLLDLANLLSLIVSLLPFQLTHFAASFFIPALCFTRQRIYLLLTARIHLRYSGVPLIPDLELLILGFFSNALDTQRLVQILFETRSHWIMRDYDCRVVELLRDAWRQISLAAAPRRMDHRVAERRQQQRFKRRLHVRQTRCINVPHVTRIDRPSKLIDWSRP